jgi:hypothetical protein
LDYFSKREKIYTLKNTKHVKNMKHIKLFETYNIKPGAPERGGYWYLDTVIGEYASKIKESSKDEDGVQLLGHLIEEIARDYGLGAPFGSKGNVLVNKFYKDLEGVGAPFGSEGNRMVNMVNKIRNEKDFISAYKILKEYADEVIESLEQKD